MRNLFNLRIPSLFGVILLLVGVGATSFLVEKGVIFQSRAAPEKTPLNIAITNVTPTSFTVMYTTEESLPGTISYGLEKTGTNVAIDDRDQQLGSSSPGTVHHITIRNLNPDTMYYFSILSGDTMFLNQDEPYQVKTASELDEESEDIPALHGNIRFAQDSEKTNLLVLLESDDTQPLSARVLDDGSYTIPLTGIRTKDLSETADLSDDDPFKLVILSNNERSDVTVLPSNTDPIPMITFGESYDFTVSEEPLADTTASASAGASFPAVSSETESGPTVKILSPDDEETFTDQKPVFSGTALPGEEISVEIHSETPITATVKASTDGSWQYRPETSLSPGVHTLTIKTRDASGTLIALTRSFTVFAQGSQFVEPSVSPTNSPTPTIAFASPTPTVTDQPTAIPTTTITDTPTPTSEILTSPSPTRPPIEATGSEDVILGGLLGLVALMGGFIVFFLTKGSTL